jgi:hypothetical protein
MGEGAKLFPLGEIRKGVEMKKKNSDDLSNSYLRASGIKKGHGKY